jgi:hypothetical protein
MARNRLRDAAPAALTQRSIAHGLKAQKKHKTLKVTLCVSAHPPGGEPTTATKPSR